MRAGKWVVLGAMLVIMLTASLAFGENPTPCYEAYLTTGLSQQQMSFEEFRKFYSDNACPKNAPGREVAGADQAKVRDGQENERFERKDHQ
jgi:hypothetical protein